MVDKHINPEDFDSRVLRNELLPVSIDASHAGKKYVKDIIESIKSYNGQDAGFCYTCRCTDWLTIWSFGYTDPVIHTKVNTIVADMVSKARKIFGLDPKFHGTIPSNYSECICPFSGAK